MAVMLVPAVMLAPAAVPWLVAAHLPTARQNVPPGRRRLVLEPARLQKALLDLFSHPLLTLLVELHQR